MEGYRVGRRAGRPPSSRLIVSQVQLLEGELPNAYQGRELCLKKAEAERRGHCMRAVFCRCL